MLFKFGKREHLEDFRRGTLHMSSQKFFSELEHDPVRSDRYEGTDQIRQPRDIQSFRIIDNSDGTQIGLGPDDFDDPLRINFGTRSYNLFCMYAVTRLPDSGGPCVDPRNLLFEDSFIAVLNPQQFIDRVAASVKSVNLGGEWRLVEYYDVEQHSGETGLFRKPATFSYQREFRIAVYPGSCEPIRLAVGDLTGITTGIFPWAEINQIVNFDQEQ